MDLNEIKKQIKPVLQKHGINQASIVGSVARDEDNENSDIDIIIEATKDMSLLTFSRLKLELENVLKKKVDLIERSAVKPRLKNYLLKDEVKVF
ncbi:MAG: nucleotidyltransferase domain-containing protein [Bacteroidales bacterium]|nr:nucleotidyltransferase domain-containing protein [Bacteroidales bacterium]